MLTGCRPGVQLPASVLFQILSRSRLLQGAEYSHRCGPAGPAADLCYSRYCGPIGLPGGSDGKASACSAGDPALIPGLGRFLGEGNGNPLQYSCLENCVGGGAWRAAVHGVAKSWTRPSTHTGSHCRIRGVFLKDTIKGSAFFTGKISKQLSYLFRGDWIVLWIEHRWY